MQVLQNKGHLLSIYYIRRFVEKNMAYSLYRDKKQRTAQSTYSRGSVHSLFYFSSSNTIKGVQEIHLLSTLITVYFWSYDQVIKMLCSCYSTCIFEQVFSLSFNVSYEHVQRKYYCSISLTFMGVPDQKVKHKKVM